MTASTTRDARAALLEQRLRRRATAGRPTVPVRPDGIDPPLSYQQERVWFMEQFAPGTSAYSIPIPVRLRGRLDVGLLRQAMDALPVRHEALRMRFPADEDGRPGVRLEPSAPVPLEIVDAADEDAARALVDAAAAEPFDLVDGPLLRALLVRLGPEDHLLSMGTHHIVGDGWSTDLLLRDLSGTYRALAAGTTPRLPAAPVRYGDFAHWQRQTLTGPRLDRELDHWSEHLRGVPPLELPIDRHRPATQTFDGDWHVVTLDRELTDGIARLGRAHGTTQFMTLLAAYQVLLSRYSGQDDFAVGSSSAGRPLPELEGVVGMFINMLPLRAQLAGDPTFAELLERTRGTVLDAFEHQDVPFERLVNALGVPRDVSRSPVFQAMFVLQNYEMGRFVADDPGELDFQWVPTELRSTRFDLELHVVEVQAGLRAKFVYNTALFEPATIARMGGQLAALLRSAVADPGRPVSTLDILGPDERALVLDGFNDTAADFPAGATLPGLIQEQVARTPDAVAVSLDGRTLTYAELNARANRVAHRLRGLGVGPETLVGICAERSPELVVGLLGVLKAGGAYVPLDPDYPVERLSFMLSDAAAPVLLVQQSLRDLLPGTRMLVLDDPAEWEAQPGTDPEPLAGPGNTAYVIYTSGSTGRPKGVANAHRAVVNRLDWMQRAYGLDGTDTVLQKTPAGFDVSVWEFFWPLLTGARLVLARPGGHKDAGYLRDVLVAESITTAHFVPSMLTVFLAEDGIEACRALRLVVCSGEELPVATAQRLTARLPGCELHNLYGPTEAAIDVSSWHCRPVELAGRNTVPIGAPIQNLRLYVLDRHGDPAPVGVPGELHIGGVGVARGYHRRPALTAEKFVPDPYGGEPGGRLYRTGDLARWRPDGTVEFLGRIDSQVKLRGLRIELGEIETTLLAQPGVAQAAVVVREDAPGDQRLAGYLVAAAGTELDPAALRTALKTTLPDYMVPAALVPLDALPLTPNGKLDRKALPAPVAQRGAAALAPPSTDTERMLAAIWQDVLNLPEVGVDDDFFDLGGHSLLATQTVARIRRESGGRPVGVMDVFAHRTIRELAAFIDAAEPEGPRRLLHELTKPIPAGQRTLSYVCLPYGGGSAIVYQPLADALPAGHSLFSVAIPGHDVGLSDDGLPFDELVDRLTAEILERVDGPLAIYGHCGVGNALAVGVARALEAAGRELEVVYIAAIFPFARLKGVVGSVRAQFERWRSNQSYADWLKGMGVDIRELDPEQADRIISTMRADSEAAEDYFSALLDQRPEKLRAPIVSIVGSADPVTDYYAERYLEWQFLSDTVGLVVLDEAGHFFLRYRAEELAQIVTTVHPSLGGPPPVAPDGGWFVQGTARAGATRGGAGGPAEHGPVRRRHRRPAGVDHGLGPDRVRGPDLPLHPDRLGGRPRPALGPGPAVRGAHAAGGRGRGRPGRPAPGHDRGQPGRGGGPARAGPAAVVRPPRGLVRLPAAAAGVGGQLGAAAGVPVGDSPAGAEAVPRARDGAGPAQQRLGPAADAAHRGRAAGSDPPHRHPDPGRGQLRLRRARAAAGAVPRPAGLAAAGAGRHRDRQRAALLLAAPGLPGDAALLRGVQRVPGPGAGAVDAAGAGLRRRRRPGPGGAGRGRGRGRRRQPDGGLGRPAPAPDDRRAGGQLRHRRRLPDHRAAPVAAGGRGRHVRDGGGDDAGPGHLRDAGPGQGAAAVPRPGVLAQPGHRLVHAAGRVRAARPVGGVAVRAAAGPGRGAGRVGRRGDRHRTRPRHWVRVRGLRGPDGDRHGLHVRHPAAAPVRHRGARLAARRPGRGAGAGAPAG